MTAAPAAAGLRRRMLAGLFSGGAGLWMAGALAVVVLVMAPVAALFLIASESSGDLWPHLAAYVLPSAFRQTAFLLLGVGAIAILVGVGAAWLVTAYDFPGRRLFDWALLLPLAVPTYVVAFAYLDLLHPVGPVQSAIRAALGIASPAGFRLPDIRSMSGAILLLGAVLCPYVYLSTRAMFIMQGAAFLDVARTLGRGRSAIFFKVAVPLARPAIAVGASLALMEALNDIGASEFLGVRTLTVSIYSTWINRSNLPGAAQIALLMLMVVVALVVVERGARRRQSYAVPPGRSGRPAQARLSGLRAALAILLCLLPVLAGFLIPTTYLLIEAARRISFAGLSSVILAETANTFLVAAIATAVAVLLGLVVAYAVYLARAVRAGGLVRLASLGYALPGTVLAIGLLSPLAGIDNAIARVSEAIFGVSTGLVLSGSVAALVYAYVVRFLAVAAGGIEAGLDKVPPSLDHSARSLGHGPASALRRVHLPMILPAIGAAALLIFVDCMKELPATLLLRPLNFETLATHLYGEAARGTYEDGAIAALLIVAVGLLPVIVLARLGRIPVRQAR